MTRIDLTTRELHALINPVLPHASTDADQPLLGCIRLEVRDNVLCAVASDRYTLAATRHALDDPADELTLLIDRGDITAALKLFTYTKDSDPELRLIVDKFPVPVGRDNTLDGLGLRIDGEDGTRLILHDRHPLGEKWPLDHWRDLVGKVIHRPFVPASPTLLLTAGFLARWSKASKGRMAVFVGPDPSSPLLVTVEDHFIGLLLPIAHLDGDQGPALLASNPWRHELYAGAG